MDNENEPKYVIVNGCKRGFMGGGSPTLEVSVQDGGAVYTCHPVALDGTTNGLTEPIPITLKRGNLFPNGVCPSKPGDCCIEVRAIADLQA